MRWPLRAFLGAWIVFTLSFAPQKTAAQSVGQSIRNLLSTPTPTPHRKKKSGKTSPTPSASPKNKTSPEEKAADQSPSPEESASPAKHARETPAPRKKKSSRTSPTPESEESPATASPKKKASPSPSASPRGKHKKKEESPSPTESPGATPTSPPNESPTPAKEQTVASISADAINGFHSYSPKVQKLLQDALELTTRNLNYKYGSADPANGGMDCSGFVYYILRQQGINDVPRDSAGQYVWLRKAGMIEPVVSRKEESFELDNLKPGDLLFWTGTYSIERDPPITHAMIYLGKEKKSGKRVMVGSSDGRTYDGQQRYGVSVFDFKLPRVEKEDATDKRPHPTFVGYGHVPELRN